LWLVDHLTLTLSCDDQVAVLFSDLVGSTELSGRMDPEDLRELISAYNRCVAETVRRFGGFVPKYMGDGVLVYFGYPHAHEDDAEQAVRAGLELTRAVAGLETRAPLQARVGIATGVVVVGDLIGVGEVERSGIVGETPNLAARLQGIADPGTVLIAEGTRKLLGDFFELNDLGTMHLKGVNRPVPVWLVRRTSPVASRFEALHPGGLRPLVGRRQETELLLRLWSKAKAGEGEVVLFSGEAGIGKSRLTAALLQEVSSEPHTRLQCFCSARHTDSALHPIIGWNRSAAPIRGQSFLTTAPSRSGSWFQEATSFPTSGAYGSNTFSTRSGDGGLIVAIDCAPFVSRGPGAERLSAPKYLALNTAWLPLQPLARSSA
jgi:class 3 adenylate cyclase